MLTQEQFDEIQSESREKGISIKKLLKEKGIPAIQYFWRKRKYGRDEIAEGFLPVTGAMPPSGIGDWRLDSNTESDLPPYRAEERSGGNEGRSRRSPSH